MTSRAPALKAKMFICGPTNYYLIPDNARLPQIQLSTWID